MHRAAIDDKMIYHFAAALWPVRFYRRAGNTRKLAILRDKPRNQRLLSPTSFGKMSSQMSVNDSHLHPRTNSRSVIKRVSPVPDGDIELSPERSLMQ
jgi:hypothetical protein